MCGQMITFPAIPPGSGLRKEGGKLAIKSSESKPASGWLSRLPAMLSFLGKFQHWKVVAQCAVPFLIIGALLAGAAYARKHFSSSSDAAPVPVVQADPGAWQHITELNKADMAVRAQIVAVKAAHNNVAGFERLRASMATAEPYRRQAAERQLQEAQRKLEHERRRFDEVYAKYQQLGGSVDYRSQLPN
jgi:hypothetical protein